MTEWLVDIHNLIPQGQLAEFLTIARVDRVTGECEVVQASMLKCGYHGEFLIPQADSPFAAFGAADCREPQPPRAPASHHGLRLEARPASLEIRPLGRRTGGGAGASSGYAADCARCGEDGARRDR